MSKNQTEAKAHAANPVASAESASASSAEYEAAKLAADEAAEKLKQAAVLLAKAKEDAAAADEMVAEATRLAAESKGKVEASKSQPANDLPDPEEELVVTVPTAYTLTHDDQTQTRFEAGVTRMKRKHAEHWHSKNCGVTPFEG